jgi:hypothetical protein
MGKSKRARADSNGRPLAPEASALSAELRALCLQSGGFWCTGRRVCRCLCVPFAHIRPNIALNERPELGLLVRVETHRPSIDPERERRVRVARCPRPSAGRSCWEHLAPGAVSAATSRSSAPLILTRRRPASVLDTPTVSHPAARSTAAHLSSSSSPVRSTANVSVLGIARRRACRRSFAALRSSSAAAATDRKLPAPAGYRRAESTTPRWPPDTSDAVRRNPASAEPRRSPRGVCSMYARPCPIRSEKAERAGNRGQHARISVSLLLARCPTQEGGEEGRGDVHRQERP